MSNVTVYVMTTWRNLPSKDSALDATNLNHLEQGIKNVTDFVNTLNASSGLYLSQTPFTTALLNKLNGIEANANNYSLPTASASTKGGVKVDAETITIDSNGVIHAAAATTQLSALTDVNLTNLQEGQILKWDATNLKWVNTSEAEVRTQLSLLEDVDIDDPEDGQTLKYNATTEKWENGEGGDVLSYDDTMAVLGIPEEPGEGNPIFQPSVYSFDEQWVGYWVDGKKLYQKSVEFGALPNADIKRVNHNIDNIEHVFIAGGIYENTNGFTNFIAGVSPESLVNQWYTGVNKTFIEIKTGTDRTNYTYVIIHLQYTKTTDPTPNN